MLVPMMPPPMMTARAWSGIVPLACVCGVSMRARDLHVSEPRW